jgi:hypothetical protein
MSKKNSDVGPGDVVELADKETSFYDPETQLNISREQTAKIEEKVGKKTHTAILSGRLMVLGSKKQRQLGAGSDDDAAPAKGGKKAAATEE